MTSINIKAKIETALLKSIELKKALSDLHSEICDEMGSKERDNLSYTEEELLSEMIMPQITESVNLQGQMMMLNNIYNR